MATLGQMAGGIRDKVAEAQVGIPELHKLEDMIKEHRVDMVIAWCKRRVKRDVIKRYIELSYEDYGLCDRKTCNAGEGCCHQTELEGVKFCSPF